MDELPINPADLVVIGIIGLSGLLAFARGFVKEVLSLVGWVVAAIVTMVGTPHVKGYTAMFVKQDPFIVSVITGVGLFIVTLVFVSLCAMAVAREVREVNHGAFDRTLGFVFGVLRGMVLICLSYLVLLWAFPDRGEHPQALRAARALPLIEMGVTLIRGLLPESMQGDRRAESPLRETDTEAAKRRREQEWRALQSPPAPRAPPAGATPGYNAQERQEKERLLQSIQQ